MKKTMLTMLLTATLGIVASACATPRKRPDLRNLREQAAEDYRKQCSSKLPMQGSGKSVDPQMDRWTCE